MVYHIQSYWDFGLFPSSGLLGTRKHEVSETGSVSFLRCGGETPTQSLHLWTPRTRECKQIQFPNRGVL
jgi:hypothetical protein